MKGYSDSQKEKKMKEDTKSRLIFLVYIVILGFLMGWMLFSICKPVKAESIEINEYPFWAVTISGDSTFQTVQILKCYEVFPNGQRKLRGYMVAVDSAGCRIYEEEPEYFLFQATIRAMRLQTELGKRLNERRIKMQDSKGNIIEPGDKLRSDESPAGRGEVRIVDISITNTVTLEWLHGSKRGERFLIDRKNLKKSSWVKVELSKIPAQRGKGD